MRQVLFLVCVGTLLLMKEANAAPSEFLVGESGNPSSGRIQTGQYQSSLVNFHDDDEDMLAMEDSSGSHESVSKVVITRQLFGDDIPTTRPLSGNYFAYYIGFPHPNSRSGAKQLQHVAPRISQDNTFTNSHKYVYTGGDAAKLFEYPTSYIPFKSQRNRGTKYTTPNGSSTKKVKFITKPKSSQNLKATSAEVGQIQFQSQSQSQNQAASESAPGLVQYLPYTTQGQGHVQLQGQSQGQSQFFPINTPSSSLTTVAESLLTEDPVSLEYAPPPTQYSEQLYPVTSVNPAQGPAPVHLIKQKPTGIKKVVGLPEIATITTSFGQGPNSEEQLEFDELFGHSGSAPGTKSESGSGLGPNEDGISFSFNFVHEPRGSRPISKSNQNKNTNNNNSNSNFHRRHQNLKLKQKKNKHQSQNQNQNQNQVNMQRRDENQHIYQQQSQHQNHQKYQLQHQHQQYQQQLAQSTLDQQYQLQQQQHQMSVPVPLPLLTRHLLRMRGMLSKITPLFQNLKVNRNGQPQSPTLLSTATIVPGSSQLFQIQRQQELEHETQSQIQSKSQNQQQDQQQAKQNKQEQPLQVQLKFKSENQQKPNSNNHNHNVNVGHSHGNLNRMHPIGYKLTFDQPTQQ